MTKRIIILLVAGCSAFAAIFLVARNIEIPKSYFAFGLGKPDILNEGELASMKYADTLSCIKCHAAIDSIKNQSAHRKFNCQICHGSGLKHINDPANNKMIKPSDRKFCLKCHTKDTCRIVTIMQIDTAKHNSKTNCTKCHNPHSPSIGASNISDSRDTVSAVKSESKTCSMCHADKNTLKSSGVHKNVLCQSCHGAGEKHMQDPAVNLMVKPSGNTFCNTCHGIGIASATNGIKQIDIKEHNPDGSCIDCHDSHSPLKGF